MKKIVLIFILISSANFSFGQCIDVNINQPEVNFVSVATNSSDFIYAVGFFSGSTTINSTTYTSPNDVGLLVLKYDNLGTLLWVNQVQGTGFYSELPVIVIDETNSRVIIADTEGSPQDQPDNMIVTAYTDQASWTEVWTQTYEATGVNSGLSFNNQIQPLRGELDSSGNLIISGAFSGPVDNTVTATSFNSTEPHSESFMIKFDSDGNELWALQTTGSTGNGDAFTLKIDLSDNIYIAGSYWDTIDFGGGISYTSGLNFSNPYVAKIDPSGTPLWVAGMESANGNNTIYDLTIDESSNVYFTGIFNETIDIRGNIINSSGGSNVLIGALDQNGDFIWANNLGGSMSPDAAEFGTHINDFLGTLVVGGGIAADDIEYGGISLGLPAYRGAFLAGIDTETGTFSWFSPHELFGYGAVASANDNLVTAELNGNNITAIDHTTRPRPFAEVTGETNQLDPTETLTAFNGSSYAFQWYQDGALLPGETNSGYIATVNGEYHVEVTSPGGCVEESERHFILDGASLASDRLALIDLYNNTDGANWNRNTNWLSADVTTWEGVSVNGGRVTGLSLAVNNLNGSFPQSFGTLSQLQTVFLDGNNISGSIPSEFWNITTLTQVIIHDNVNLTWSIEPGIQNMSNLAYLRAFNTNLSGAIPPEIGGATGLIEIWLSNCNLTGSLPAELGMLTNLDFLELSSNNLNGAIPSALDQLANLSTLYLNANQFSGSFPLSIWQIPNLRYLSINTNPTLSITLPTDLEQLTQLRMINIWNTIPIGGAFPEDLYSLTNLEIIALGSNQFTGTLDSRVGNWSSLNELYLWGNLLDGSLPTQLGSLSNLTNMDLGGNNFSGSIPTELGNLSNLVELNLYLNKLTGSIPPSLGNLSNLVHLDLAPNNLTGTVPVELGNLSQLEVLWLNNNELSGSIPAEFINLTNLRELYLMGSEFTDVPDLSSLSNLQIFNISNNFFDFDDVIPNLSTPAQFTYAPQKRRDASFVTVDPGGDIDFINPYLASGNVYQWFKNTNDSGVTTVDYSITGATIDDLGGYFAQVTNPAVPDLFIFTRFHNVAFSGAPRSWSVDNAPGSVADFKSLYSAVYGTNENDTLYVAGSADVYAANGQSGFTLDLPRTIYGPGYFLAENSETQATPFEAQTPYLNVKTGGSGSQIYGMTFDNLRLNSQSSSLDDTLRDVTISNSRVKQLSISDDSEGIEINKSFIDHFSFTSTTALNTSRSYQNISIENNIIDTVTTILAKATAARNVMSNVTFNRNTIDIFTDSIQDATLTDNIINDYQATANTGGGTTIGYGTANFTNSSGTLTIDNDYVPTDNDLNKGAFSEPNPYVLSGLATIPHIYTLNNAGRIRLFTEVKNESNADITTLRYRLGESGSVVQKGKVQRLEAAQDVALTFRPKLGNVTPGGNVDVMIWAQDANGLKSVPQRLSFIAETTTATGSIFTADNSPVTNGDVLLFEINQEGTAFDTLSTSLNNQGDFTFNNIVIGDYLALAEANASDFPGHLPTYYEQIDLWEEADTLLIDTDNPEFNITLIAEPKDPTGNGMISGFIEEEIEEGSDDDGGRVLARKRVGRSGVSMRRRVRAGRPEEDTFELVEFVLTNSNGEFLFENLPADEYRINIQYPGYPMDTLSDIDLNVRENADNAYELAALVDEGKISVTILSTTGVIDEIVERVSVYPNPTTTESINISFTSEADLSGLIGIRMFDIKGTELIYKEINAASLDEERTINLPFNGIKAGTYLLKLNETKGEIGTIRLVIR